MSGNKFIYYFFEKKMINKSFGINCSSLIEILNILILIYQN